MQARLIQPHLRQTVGTGFLNPVKRGWRVRAEVLLCVWRPKATVGQTAAPGRENYLAFRASQTNETRWSDSGLMRRRCEKITAAAEVGWLHGVVIQYEGFCISYVGMQLHESWDRSPT
jgi:hypothetical protein